MSFDKFVNYIKEISQTAEKSFLKVTQALEEYVKTLTKKDFLDVLCEIGTIPERIEYDSSEEKVFSKATDFILSRSFVELGLKSKVLTARGNSADVMAESYFHGYSLVADAKAFRLSRTAKNQKDFKVKSLSGWRGEEHDYAVLATPYNQYPTTTSQIYMQALTENVYLLTWEHLYFLIINDIKETVDCSLAFLWNASASIAQDPTFAFAEGNKCFLPKINALIFKKFALTKEDFLSVMQFCNSKTIKRGKIEIEYWKNQIELIKGYTRQQAIEELIKTKKIKEKIRVIEKYVSALKDSNE